MMLSDFPVTNQYSARRLIDYAVVHIRDNGVHLRMQRFGNTAVEQYCSDEHRVVNANIINANGVYHRSGEFTVE